MTQQPELSLCTSVHNLTAKLFDEPHAYLNALRFNDSLSNLSLPLAEEPKGSAGDLVVDINTEKKSAKIIVSNGITALRITIEMLELGKKLRSVIVAVLAEGGFYIKHCLPISGAIATDLEVKITYDEKGLFNQVNILDNPLGFNSTVFSSSFVRDLQFSTTREMLVSGICSARKYKVDFCHAHDDHGNDLITNVHYEVTKVFFPKVQSSVTVQTPFRLVGASCLLNETNRILREFFR